MPNEKLKITRLSGPNKREQRRQKIYQVFRTKTQEFFPNPLPEKVAGAMFIYFDQDWHPQLSRFRSESIFSLKPERGQFDDAKFEALNTLNSILY
jgi:hypothetical protein